MLQAYREIEKDAEEKERIKKEDRVLKQWIRLVHGLRIRHRLQKQYGSRSDERAEGLVDAQTDEEGQKKERDLVSFLA